MVVGAGSSRSLTANQLWAKGKANEYAFPVPMIVLFRIGTEINFQ